MVQSECLPEFVRIRPNKHPSNSRAEVVLFFAGIFHLQHASGESKRTKGSVMGVVVQATVSGERGSRGSRKVVPGGPLSGEF